MATADCTLGFHATGGGGNPASGDMMASYPSDSAGAAVAAGSTNPRYWTAKFSTGNMSNTAYAICVPN